MALILKGRAKLKGSTVIGKRPYAIDGVFNPELVLDFHKDFYRTNSVAKTFPNAITHTRASTATYVDSTGTLQTAAVNEPRLGHHVYNGTAFVNEGLLHESEARTNLALYSEDLSNAAWVKFATTVTANDAVAPDGASTADRLIENSSTGFHVATQNISIAADTVNTVSLFVKAGSTSDRALRFSFQNAAGTDGVRLLFNPNTNAIVLSQAFGSASNLSVSVQDASSGWYRIFLTGKISTVDTAGIIFTTLQTDFTAFASASYTGNGVSNLLLWGAQLEAAPTPSSYIPTAGSTVTRSADVLTIPAANLPYPEPVVIGPELTPDPSFDDPTATNDETVAGYDVVGGELVVVSAPAFHSSVGQNLVTPLVAGKVYEVSYTITEYTSGTIRSILVGGGINISQIARTAAGTFKQVVVAAGNHNIFGFQSTVSGTTLKIDNISVREINPLALSIQMDGRVTYADEGTFDTLHFMRWEANNDNRIRIKLDTDSTRIGRVIFFQKQAGIELGVASADNAYSAGVFVPFNISSRHGSTFVNGATDGTALTANTTPTALADLSATNLSLGNDYNGTIRTFRMWAQDISDAGLVEATEPSLVPSLSLTFDGTENSFIVNDWSE